MNFTRRKRIVLQLVGPPVFGAALMAASATVSLAASGGQPFGGQAGTHALFDALKATPLLFLMYVVFAVPTVGIQAGLYAAFMEWRFARGLDPRSWRAVAWSTALGFPAGAVVALAYGPDRLEMWYLFGPIGPLVGLVLGLLIRRWSAPAGGTP